MKVKPNFEKSLLDLASPRWTAGIVYYTINSMAYTTNQAQTIYTSMRLLENQTRHSKPKIIFIIKKSNVKNFFLIKKDQMAKIVSNLYRV